MKPNQQLAAVDDGPLHVGEDESTLSEHELATELRQVQRQPSHLIASMIRAQKNLLEQNIEQLAKADATRNLTIGQLDRSYDDLIRPKEAMLEKLMASMRDTELELKVLRQERRSRRQQIEDEHLRERNFLTKIIGSLRELVNSLEAQT